MRLIIDIDNYQYEHFLRHYKDEPSPRLIDEIIANGIPLDDIKAELERAIGDTITDYVYYLVDKHIKENKK